MVLAVPLACGQLYRAGMSTTGLPAHLRTARSPALHQKHLRPQSAILFDLSNSRTKKRQEAGPPGVANERSNLPSVSHGVRKSGLQSVACLRCTGLGSDGRRPSICSAPRPVVGLVRVPRRAGPALLDGDPPCFGAIATRAISERPAIRTARRGLPAGTMIAPLRIGQPIPASE
ncbi:hypothetical protein TBK1r_06710 [Stieleria magnilauensis]|uniref:Uncharacterized protein n=1 Tax=Stieleria magnilauensis TaxID=2527963 RepID=A0ABX5XM84_9BACT|nr:hypothetical protein TBK1r_06710 [Planctomycetes bacterium TBK1r]